MAVLIRFVDMTMLMSLYHAQRLVTGFLLFTITFLGCQNSQDGDKKPHAFSTTTDNSPEPLIANDTAIDADEVTSAVDAAPTRNVDTSAPLRAPKPGEWGAGCNAALLAGPFSLKNATDVNVSQADFRRITEIIEEVKAGNEGMLALAPRDPVLDSSAFLAQYLRAFGNPDDMLSYDHHFERIQSRLSDAKTVLDDDRLDWDIWRTYLLFEQFAAGRSDWNTYRSLSTFGSKRFLYSAKDLLWEYLIRNAKRIREDKDRLRWWIDTLSTDLQAPGGRPVRRWFLLQLVASSDTKTAALLDDQADPIPGDYSMKPNPIDPFINLDLVEFHTGEEADEQPAFLQAIEKIAASQKLSFEIWAIDPATMPSTKVVVMDLAPRATDFVPTSLLSQESWSESPDPDWFGVYFARPFGSRAAYAIWWSMPTSGSKDGVFFFTYNSRLYVWPKSKMDAAAIQMLHVSGLIDGATYARFRVQGFDPLQITATSDHQ